MNMIYVISSVSAVNACVIISLQYPDPYTRPLSVGEPS